MVALRRIGGGADFMVLGMVAVTAATVVWALAGFPFLSWETEEPVRPKPSPSLTFMRWTFEGRRCADGWPSLSIGRQGACSHHGGVVSVWSSPEGYTAVCRHEVPLLMTEEAAEDQMREHGRIIC